MSRAEYDFSAAYQRLLQVTGAASQTALATALGINQSSVWDVVRRADGIPASWLVALVERLGISPLWIRTGQGPQRLTRSLGEIPLEELMAEIGRRHDDFYRRWASPPGAPQGRDGQSPTASFTTAAPDQG